MTYIFSLFHAMLLGLAKCPSLVLKNAAKRCYANRSEPLRAFCSMSLSSHNY